MKLTVNMRLGSGSNSSERKEIQDFADWILNIGNGKIGGKNDGEANVEFPDDMLIPDSDEHIERAILASTHELVDMINDRMLSLLHGDEKTYNSSDTVGVADVDTNFNETMYTEEFLNNLNMAGILHHSIKLKIVWVLFAQYRVCQGQTLSKVGLFLQRPFFSHGQLYVAVLRVKTKKGLKVL
ncbi:ATP-dependent DNA helicase PIF1-like protein [Tanacetum coccineum]